MSLSIELVLFFLLDGRLDLFGGHGQGGGLTEIQLDS